MPGILSFACVVSCNLNDNSKKVAQLIFSFFRWENWGSRILSNLTKVIQLRRTEIGMQNEPFNHYFLWHLRAASQLQQCNDPVNIYTKLKLGLAEYQWPPEGWIEELNFFWNRWLFPALCLGHEFHSPHPITGTLQAWRGKGILAETSVDQRSMAKSALESCRALFRTLWGGRIESFNNDWDWPSHWPGGLGAWSQI